jgi:hypothetical protein
VSPFGHPFSPPLHPFPRSPRAVSPLSTAFTPNRPLTPLSTAFTQIDRGVGFVRHSVSDLSPVASRKLRVFTRLPPLRFSCLSFSRSSCLFSMACGLFLQIPGVGVSPRRAHRREKQRKTLVRRATVWAFATIRRAFRACDGRYVPVRNATWTRPAHPTIITGERCAAGSRFQVYG